MNLWQTVCHNPNLGLCELVLEFYGSTYQGIKCNLAALGITYRGYRSKSAEWIWFDTGFQRKYSCQYQRLCVMYGTFGLEQKKTVCCLELTFSSSNPHIFFIEIHLKIKIHINFGG